ncbi:phage protease [Roseibium sp. SCP14]|uniref:phage protease n=1 Tax=Roseibium sp. SCP14 TaxID=3141375 RepID=UPI00333A2FF4
MTKRAANLVIAAADPVSAEKSGAWIKLMPAGTFTLRDDRGPFTSGDNASMEAIVERTKEHLSATEMMVDYDHQVLATAEDGGATAKAAGWIKEFEVRDDGIYGLVEWTEAAAKAIEAKEYRYLSPLFITDKKGRVIQLLNVALVNMPAMDLEAIAARAELTLNEGPNMDPILKALGLSEEASDADALSAIEALKAGQASIAAAAGLKEDAGAEAIAAAVSSAVKNSKPDPAKYVPVEQVNALQEQFNELKEGIDGDKAEAVVAAAIKDGKLVPALKDWGLDLAKKSLDEFEAFAASAPVLTKSQLGDKDTTKDTATAETPEAIAAAATAYQKKLQDQGQEIDFASAVAAVQEKKK